MTTYLEALSKKDFTSFIKSVKEKVTSFFNPEEKKTNECLVNEQKAKEILEKLQSKGNIIDDNIKFILGSCNPVVLIPGLYASRLVLNINCKNFMKNPENERKLRLYCEQDLCGSGKETEEHVIWPALAGSAFKLMGSGDDYSACFGYFSRFYHPNECPTSQEQKGFLNKDEENICLSDDSVKITYYGGTKDTESKSQCGIKAIKNIMSLGTEKISDNFVNSGSLGGYQYMYKRFYSMGYRLGFSLAGVPYDFRRFISTNNFFRETFKSHVETLYKNTGKPVIIISHSYGTLNTLNKLFESDSKFLVKIKKFIAIGPPFTGVSKSIELFLTGSEEFTKKLSFNKKDLYQVGLDTFGQKMMSLLLPTGFELKPNPVFNNLFKDSEYSDLKKALQERIKLESDCEKKDCDKTFINNNSKIFTSLFQSFPQLNEKECSIKSILNSKTYSEFQKKFKKNSLPGFPNVLPCRFSLYDISSCPLLKYRSANNESPQDIQNFCGKQSESTKEKKFYNVECKNEQDLTCLDNFFPSHHPNIYTDSKMKNIVTRFNKNYSNKNPKKFIKIVLEKFQEVAGNIRNKIRKLMEYQSKISKINNLEVPLVDTIIIYGGHMPTSTALLYDKKINAENFRNEDRLYKGGDGTVPSWASLLVGMKWLYEKKKKNISQKIQIVEYCSLLGDKNSKFAFDKKNPDKEFTALSCDCISKGFYNYEKLYKQDCEHSTMTSDSHVIQFVENYIKDEKYTEISSFDEERENALKYYNSGRDFEQECNRVMKKFSDRGL